MAGGPLAHRTPTDVGKGMTEDLARALVAALFACGVALAVMALRGC